MPRRSLILAIGVLAALLGLISWRLRGPDPRPADAPTDQFSSARAIAVLSDLLREGMPHPVGSPLNKTIRQRIEGRFQSLGYTTMVQRDFVCNSTPACATVENVFAYPPGSEGPWVVLLAHYDSVGAGPGASDDGVGIAALLEVARALGTPSNVAFLMTDGEEAGLLGAEAFVKSSWKDRVSIIVNVEHRGTSGPSFLFETSRGNAGLMQAVRSLKRPAASSLFYTIYEMLPNDTDVTVFKKAGVAALNFGAIGDVWYYHTPLDDLAHVNPRTVQHHGENLLASARALQSGFHRTQHNATFFDVLNLFLVSWPEGWTVWIAVASLVVLIAGLRGQSWRSVAVGAGLTLLTLGIAVIIGWLLIFLAHRGAGSAGRLATPGPVVIAMWLAGAAAAVLAFSMSRATDRRGLYSGAGVVWNVSALALAMALPGAAFLVLVPAVAFALCIVVRANPLLTTMITSAMAALVLFPLALFLYPALGKSSLAPIAALIALVFTTVAPWLQPRSTRLGAGLAFLASAAAATTLAFPTYTAERPRRASIDHELPAPTVSAIVNRSGDVATIRVSSERNADRLMIEFDERVDVLRVNGVAPVPPNRDRVWRGALTVYASEANIEVRGREGIEFTATDLTYGLPEAERDAARQRISKNGVPTHRGNVTLSSVKGRI
jgi:hypothetical protein